MATYAPLKGLGLVGQSIEDYEAQCLTSPPVLQQPVGVVRAWSSQSISQFTNSCVNAAVQPVYEYAESALVRQGWSVKLWFVVRMYDGREKRCEVSDPGPFSTKKEAKAAASERGRRLLEQALEERGAERLHDLHDTESQGEAIPMDEDWVGSLLEDHCRVVGMPAPSYHGFCNGSTFSAECSKESKKNKVHTTAVHAPSANPSVSTSTLNGSAVSSSIAIAPPWLSAQSKLGPTMTGRATGASPASSSSSNPNSPLLADLSPGEQLNRLCMSLGIAQHVFRMTPDPLVLSMWSGAVFFPQGPLPDEPVGQVTNIYGKANARKQIAEGAVRVLLKWREERERMADGIVGGLRVAGSAGASANLPRRRA